MILEYFLYFGVYVANPLNTWNTSTLFVKKAAIYFLATYLYGILEVIGLFKEECLEDAIVNLTTNLFIYNRSN